MHPIVAALQAHARLEPGKISLRWCGIDYPYAELASLISTRARRLQLKGIRAQDVITFEAEDGIESIVNTAALWLLGASAFPYDPRNDQASRTSAIHNRATGYLHRGNDLVRPATPHSLAPVRSHGEPSLIFFAHSRPGTRFVSSDALHQAARASGDRFRLNGRTLFGWPAVHDPGSIVSIWAPLASGGTAELVSNGPELTTSRLSQCLSDTEADIAVLHRNGPDHLSDVETRHFAHFKDVIFTGSPDRRTRHQLMQRIPHVRFHNADPLSKSSRPPSAAL